MLCHKETNDVKDQLEKFFHIHDTETYMNTVSKNGELFEAYIRYAVSK